MDLKNTVNGMVIQLRALAAEVTRVTLEVGSQGKLGGQADVPDVEGVWYELVRNVSNAILLARYSPDLTCFPAGQSNVFVLDGSSAIHRRRYDRCRWR